MSLAELVSTILPHRAVVVTDERLDAADAAPLYEPTYRDWLRHDAPDDLLFEPGNRLVLDTAYGRKIVTVEEYHEHGNLDGETLVVIRKPGQWGHGYTVTATAVRERLVEVL